MLGCTISELTLQYISSILDEVFTITIKLAIFKLSFKWLTFRAIKGTLSRHNSFNDYTDIVISIRKGYITLTIRLIVLENPFIDITVLFCEDSISFSWVEVELTFVTGILLLFSTSVVINDAHSVHLSLKEGTPVDLSIRPLFQTLSCYFTFTEITCVSWAISH